MEQRLRRSIIFWLPRLVISLALVFGVAYFLVVQPQNNSSLISNHTFELNEAKESLQKAKDKIQELEDPNTIIPASPGARKYADKLSEARDAFKAHELVVPVRIEKPIKDEKIDSFNHIVLEPNYRRAVLQTSEVLKQSKDFLIHQAAVMRALANLLEYDARYDLSPKDFPTLTQHLEAAEGGLENTIQRLGDSPEYNNDRSIESIINTIKQLQKDREKLENSLDSTQFNKLKDGFIALVSQVQKIIISDRSSFWGSESKRLLTTAEQELQRLEPYLVRLEKIE